MGYHPTRMPAPTLDVLMFDIDDTLYSTTAFSHDARQSAISAMIHQGLEITEEEGVKELTEVVAEFTSNYDEHLDRLLDRLGPARWGGRNPAVLVAAGVVAYHQTKERQLRPLPGGGIETPSVASARPYIGNIASDRRPAGAK